jgi:hypothetical protein
MKALVVYESLWGNTAAVAREVAAGIGPDVEVLTTDAATPDKVADADLIVAGAPVQAFHLGDDRIRASIARDEAGSATPPDLAHPSMRSWIGSLPYREARMAAFETRIWWSPRGATGDIERLFGVAGYRPIAKAEKFVVKDKAGPLREGELERARRWGEEVRAEGER